MDYDTTGIAATYDAARGYAPEVMERWLDVIASHMPPDPRLLIDLGCGTGRFTVPLAERFSYDAARRTMFINFEHLAVKRPADVDAVREEVERHLAPLGEKVWAVVNYDHFVLDPEVADDWAAMVRELVDRHYAQVVRYSTSGFLRAKLGPALAARGVASHLYESADQARAGLKRPG